MMTMRRFAPANSLETSSRAAASGDDSVAYTDSPGQIHCRDSNQRGLMRPVAGSKSVAVQLTGDSNMDNIRMSAESTAAENMVLFLSGTDSERAALDAYAAGCASARSSFR